MESALVQGNLLAQSVFSSLASQNVERVNIPQGIYEYEQKLTFSHLHAQGLGVPKVFFFFEPSVSVTSTMTTTKNSMGLGATLRNLFQMNTYKKLESDMWQRHTYTCLGHISYALV